MHGKGCGLLYGEIRSAIVHTQDSCLQDKSIVETLRLGRNYRFPFLVKGRADVECPQYACYLDEQVTHSEIDPGADAASK